MNKIRRWLMVLGISLLLQGCDLNRASISASQRGEVRPDQPIWGTLWSERYHYEQDESIHLRLTLENFSDEEVVLENAERPVVDIVFVETQEGPRWSEEVGRANKVSRLVLAPHERYVIDWILPPLPAGWYSVYGLWESTNGEVRLAFCQGLTQCPSP